MKFVICVGQGSSCFQGHVGSTNWGINFLVEEAIVPLIVSLAEECENFAIRGYVMLLLLL